MTCPQEAGHSRWLLGAQQRLRDGGHEGFGFTAASLAPRHHPFLSMEPKVAGLPQPGLGHASLAPRHFPDWLCPRSLGVCGGHNNPPTPPERGKEQVLGQS